MDCKQCAEELTAYLDGELGAADSDRVKSHLRTCVSCSEELRSLQDVGDFIQSHSRALDPRPGSWNIVRANIGQQTPECLPRGWMAHRWQLAVAAFGLIAAFIIGYAQYAQVQQRDIERYMSQYVREREAHQPQSQNDNPYAYNPFIEVSTSGTQNPFQLEDR